MRQKKAVILAASGGELANQLWNYASIYAYALERGYVLENPSFFEYGSAFALQPPSRWLWWVFFLPFKNYTKRKQSFKRRVWRKLYGWYVRGRMRRHAGQILSCPATSGKPYYLPPTDAPNDALLSLEARGSDLYFDGWLFRNPRGLERYRSEIRAFFRPRADIAQRVTRQMAELRARSSHVIGVHVRQGDYRNWRGGIFLIQQTRVREIIEEYLRESGLDRQKTTFLFTSDGPIDRTCFVGLQVVVSAGDAVTDLFLLAATDAVIGSNSTFGAFAAYLANVPFIVMQRDSMDWLYYKEKKHFFENKYSTMVFY